MAIETQGTRFFWSTSTAKSTAQEILGVEGWDGLGGVSPVIDVTNLKSTAREKKAGIRDPGELSLTLHYDPTTGTGQHALRTDAGLRLTRKMVVKYSTVDANGIGLEVNAQSGGVAISGTVDDKVMGTAQIILQNAVTETTFAT